MENYNLRTKLTRIDMIDDKTIAFYGSGGSGDPSVGGFTWSGHFTWESLPEQVTGPPTWSRLSLNFFIVGARVAAPVQFCLLIWESVYKTMKAFLTLNDFCMHV